MICRKDVLRAEVDEKITMLFDEDSRKIVLLNKSAVYFFDLCGGRTLDEINAAFIEHYSASVNDAERLSKDAENVYSFLLSQGLISDVFDGERENA